VSYVNFYEKVFLLGEVCCKVFHAWGLAAYSQPENVNGIGIATCVYCKWGVKGSKIGVFPMRLTQGEFNF
jgi:hypothetical protein